MNPARIHFSREERHFAGRWIYYFGGRLMVGGAGKNQLPGVEVDSCWLEPP